MPDGSHFGNETYAPDTGRKDDCAQATIERITLRRTSPSFGFADVRLNDVHLRGLRVEERPGGDLTVTAPERVDSQGWRWPVFALQPGCREAVEAAMAVLWARSEARS